MLLEFCFACLLSLFCALFALQRSKVEKQKLLLWEESHSLAACFIINVQALGNIAEVSTSSTR